MLPALPLLLIVIEKLWYHRQELMASIVNVRLVGIFAAFLILHSLVVQVIGISELYVDKTRDKKLLQDIRKRPESVFITDSFWFPQEMAALYDTKKFFFVKNGDNFELIIEKLYKNRVNSFAYITTEEGGENKLHRLNRNIREVEKTTIPSGFLLRSFIVY